MHTPVLIVLALLCALAAAATVVPNADALTQRLHERDDVHVLHRVRAEFADSTRRELQELLTTVRDALRHSVSYDADSYAHLLHPDVHYVDQERRAQCVGAEQTVRCLTDLEQRARAGAASTAVEFQLSAVTQGAVQVVRELRAHRSAADDTLVRQLNVYWVHSTDDGRIVLIERMRSVADPLRLPVAAGLQGKALRSAQQPHAEASALPSEQ